MKAARSDACTLTAPDAGIEKIMGVGVWFLTQTNRTGLGRHDSDLSDEGQVNVWVEGVLTPEK